MTKQELYNQRKSKRIRARINELRHALVKYEAKPIELVKNRPELYELIIQTS